MKRAFVLMTLVASVVLGACQQASYEPHAIDHDIDTCEICNMAINDRQAATQIVMEDGRAVKFDDIGCMMQYKEENEDTSDTFHTEYINSYDEQGWVEAKESIYVYDEDINTPMGNGVISFSSLENAETFIEKEGYGELLQYEDLSKHDWDSY